MERISARTVPIMLGAVAPECFSIRAVRATCCGHVLVFVCSMVVCGHCPVFVYVACVCCQLVMFFKGTFRLDQTSCFFLIVSLI